MTFDDLQTESGLQKLDSHLAKNSFVGGDVPSSEDVTLFRKVMSGPYKFVNVARWYACIKANESKFSDLPVTTVEDDEDDVDLFGSDDEEDEEAERIKAERVADYNKRKAEKVKPAAKTVVTLDVKPWDDETDMKILEESVREIDKDGLVWGSSKLVPIGYGIKKLQITVVVEDEKVSLDELQEEIAEIEDYVQSTDIQAMQKL